MQFGKKPQGLGIDCPMWWSSRGSSDRRADKWLRSRYHVGSTVQPANSLRGAVLVQGMMLAWRVREAFANVPITEAHPKALRTALNLMSWSSVVRKFKLRESSQVTSISGTQLWLPLQQDWDF